MNAKYSILLFLGTLDDRAKTPFLKGIGNRSLSIAIGACSQMIREQERKQQATKESTPASADERVAWENSIFNREPPVGLTPAEKPEERLARALHVYHWAYLEAQKYAKGPRPEFALVQTPMSRLDWMRQRAEINSQEVSREAATIAEKAALGSRAGTAKRDLEFLKQYSGEISQTLVAELNSISDDESEDFVRLLDGVFAYDLSVSGLQAQGQEMARLFGVQGMLRAGSTLQMSLQSDLALIELNWHKTRKFIRELETHNSVELTEIIAKTGRNFLTIDAVDDQIEQACGIKVKDLVEAYEAKQKKAESDTPVPNE